jgi:hypothetical protein
VIIITFVWAANFHCVCTKISVGRLYYVLLRLLFICFGIFVSAHTNVIIITISKKMIKYETLCMIEIV